MKTTDILLGLSQAHLEYYEPEKQWLTPRTIKAYQSLKESAAKTGFQIKIASGFRSFDRQLAVWNEKAMGKRTVLNSQEKPVDMAKLSDDEKVKAILTWSSLPGLSRHHWGTEIDIFPANLLPQENPLQLTAQETEKGGHFFPFYQWLTKNELSRHGFYRPYQSLTNGVKPENWHLSLYSEAHAFWKQHSTEILENHLKGISISLKDSILSALESIFQKYFKTIDLPPSPPL